MPREQQDPFRDYRAKIGTVDERIGTAMQGWGDVDEDLNPRITRFMQQFGFTSYPPGGTECAIIETDAGPCAIATDHLDGEPDIAPGWSAQYDLDGNYVMLKRDDGVEIVAADGKITITAATADDIEIVANGGGDIRIENGTGTTYLHASGSLEAARKGDTVTDTASMATWISTMTSYVNTIIGILGVPSPPAPVVLPIVPPGSFGTISSGSSNVKIG
jgi:phage gp45-like